jgi:hypothetical protein
MDGYYEKVMGLPPAYFSDGLKSLCLYETKGYGELG